MLFQTITDDMKNAMRNKNKIELNAIRSLFSAIKTEAINQGNREEIADETCITVIKKQVKQRKDSIEQFTKGGREDLAENEKKELTILEKYLPEMMSKEAIEKIVLEAKNKNGITEKQDFGKLMGIIMKKLKAEKLEADGNIVKESVQKILN